MRLYYDRLEIVEMRQVFLSVEHALIAIIHCSTKVLAVVSTEFGLNLVNGSQSHAVVVMKFRVL